MLLSDPVDDEFVFDPKYWDYPFASTVAVLVVSFGVRGLKDIYYATVCQLLFWGFGHKGPDGIYNALAGLQAGRGEWFYAAFPTLLDTYEGITELRRTRTLSTKSIIRTGSWALGFYLGRTHYLGF